MILKQEHKSSSAKIITARVREEQALAERLKKWHRKDPFEAYQKEIDKLKHVLHTLIKHYETTQLTGNHRKAFNDALEKAKRLINF